jgi:hypothetical protein
MRDGYCYKCKTFYTRFYRAQPHSCQVVDPTTQPAPRAPIMSERRRYSLWRALQKYQKSTRAQNSKESKK